MPLTPDDLFQRLEALGISTSTVRHPPLFTVEESKALRGEIPGAHTKNLFVRDKKGRFFLITVEEEAEVDLKTLHRGIGASGRLSFGKPEQLMALLGVAPGSVTVFGAANDLAGEVSVVLDSGLLQNDIINAHPLTNEATTSIRREDLLHFLKQSGHPPAILKVAA
jgi:Ala-tRNA(Pro) deacylase